MTMRGRQTVGYTVFLAVAFGGAWALWMTLALSGQTVVVGQGWPSHLPGLAAPAVGAIVAVAVVDGRRGLREFARRTVQWQLSALSAVILDGGGAGEGLRSAADTGLPIGSTGGRCRRSAPGGGLSDGCTRPSRMRLRTLTTVVLSGV